MAEKLLINRKKDQAHKEILTRAIENNFRRETVFSFRADGTIGGNIRPHRILAGAAGIQHTTVLIFGVDVQRSHYEFQDIELSAEAIEAKLISLFSGLPGTNTVCYSREFTPKGSCYVAVFAWDESTKWHFKDFLLSVEKDTSNGFDSRHQRRSKSQSKLSDHAIRLYLEERRKFDSRAIELQVPLEEVPGLVGIENSQYIATSVAKAVFGSNEGVESAVYIRSNYGPADLASNIDKFVDRTTRRQARPIESISAGNFDDPRPEKRSMFPDKTDYGVYKLGGTIFQLFENLETYLCSTDEIFRDGASIPSCFDPRQFLIALKELAVNAFAHGQWASGYDHTRDDKHSWHFGNSIAFAHLGNRLEVINRQATRICNTNTRTTRGFYDKKATAIHLALKDIGLASCRNIGLRLAKSKIVKMGMPMPAIIDDVDHFRFIIPLAEEPPVLLIPKNGGGQAENLIAEYFILKAARLVHQVDENVISSLLQMPILQAAHHLYELGKSGVLQMKVDKVPFLFSDYDQKSWPRYVMHDEVLLVSRLGEIEASMSLLPPPVPMSLGGLYNLSRKSLWHLVAEDFSNAVWESFKCEGIYGALLDALTDQYCKILKPYRRILGRDYA